MDKRSRRISAPQFKIVYLCCVGESPPVETSLASVQAAQKQLSPVPTWQSSVSFSVCRAAGFLVRLVRRPVRTHCSAALFFPRRDMNRSRAAAGTEESSSLSFLRPHPLLGNQEGSLYGWRRVKFQVGNCQVNLVQIAPFGRRLAAGVIRTE